MRPRRHAALALELLASRAGTVTQVGVRCAVLALVLLASRANAVTREWLPAGGTSSATVAAANTLYCVRTPALYNVTGTALAFRIQTGVNGTNTGMGIYPDGDASTALGVTWTYSAPTGSTTSDTGLTVNLTAGVLYRVCVCSSSTSVRFSAIELEGTAAGFLAENGLGTYFGSSSNCTNGVPNTTTGALSAVNSGVTGIPSILIEQVPAVGAIGPRRRRVSTP